MRPRLGTGKDNIATAVGRPATVSLINGTFHLDGEKSLANRTRSPLLCTLPFKSSESIIDHYLLIVRRNLIFSFPFDSIGSRCGDMVRLAVN